MWDEEKKVQERKMEGDGSQSGVGSRLSSGLTFCRDYS